MIYYVSYTLTSRTHLRPVLLNSHFYLTSSIIFMRNIISGKVLPARSRISWRLCWENRRRIFVRRPWWRRRWFHTACGLSSTCTRWCRSVVVPGEIPLEDRCAPRPAEKRSIPRCRSSEAKVGRRIAVRDIAGSCPTERSPTARTSPYADSTQTEREFCWPVFEPSTRSCRREMSSTGSRVHDYKLLPGPFLLSYSVFDFIFSLFFRFWPCARLSWPSPQLFNAR